MSLKYGKKQIEQMAAVLDGDYGTVNEAAFAALEEAERIFEERNKFVVVGQLAGTRERQTIDPADPEAIKLALGWYSTEGDANTAASSLWSSTSTGDRFRVWVLNVFHGTAAEWHAKRKAQYVELESKQKEARTAKMHADIAKRQQEAQARSEEGKGACDCTHAKYEHRMDGSSTGACGLTECACPKFRERKK